jgi:NodT family efflux transporter outer membrane factor (OMF) lipoprotein
MRRAGGIFVALLLAGCAVTVPDPTPPAPAATEWQAALPHEGSPASLARWWQRFDDPTLAQLIDLAQRDNPGLAASLARIDQARATARVAGATRLPSLDANGTVTRQFSPQPPSVTYSLAGVSLDALWELDMFGANRRTREAALERLDARTAEWHDARVTLAAQLATTYADLRLCEALVQVYQQDVTSQRLVLDLTRRKVRGGFSSPADAALISAGAAEASNRVRAQRGQCDLLVKSLVTLTAQPEPFLRQQLSGGSGRLPQPELLRVTQVPAAALAQRPDLAALERELVAASHEVGVAEATVTLASASTVPSATPPSGPSARPSPVPPGLSVRPCRCRSSMPAAAPAPSSRAAGASANWWLPTASGRPRRCRRWRRRWCGWRAPATGWRTPSEQPKAFRCT